MVAKTEPETRDELETEVEYEANYHDVLAVARLLRPGDVVTVTRASDRPAPARIRILRDEGIAGISPDGRVWDIAEGHHGVATISAASDDRVVELIGFAVESLA